MTAAYFDERVAINLRPHFFAAQAVLGSMRARGGGCIVNIGSASWKIKGAGYAVYATCKSAMLGFTRVLAREVGKDNIRVNCIVPGWVMTARQKVAVAGRSRRARDGRKPLHPRAHPRPGHRAHGVVPGGRHRAHDHAQEFVVDAGWT